MGFVALGNMTHESCVHGGSESAFDERTEGGGRSDRFELVESVLRCDWNPFAFGVVRSVVSSAIFSGSSIRSASCSDMGLPFTLHASTGSVSTLRTCTLSFGHILFDFLKTFAVQPNRIVMPANVSSGLT